MEKKFFITTPIYYVNDVPHIGHAYTTIAADVLARAHREQNENVFFLTGTDEHGLKIQKKAEEKGINPQKFVDEVSAEFKSLWDKLGIKYDNFIRTTDPAHKAVIQKVLQAFFDKDAIYKGEYEGLYCIECEQFRNKNELINDRCPDHDTILENVREECYLLKMGELQDKLIGEIEKDKFAIQPSKYKKEILSFLKKEKLKDISISRKNVKWGIPLPFDQEHTTYVWIDAFLNYLTGLGWDGNMDNIPDKWPADVQLIGKDILRVHATIWPIMLMHLEIALPKILYVHGHLLSSGRKMSKTIGNVISIDEMLEKFGVDGMRYLLMSAGTFGDDVDITMERMVEKYNADLANGLGNLVSRVIKLLPQNLLSSEITDKSRYLARVKEIIKNIEISEAFSEIWKIVRQDDKFIEENKPWELIKGDKDKFNKVMQKLISDLYLISELLIPFLPETSEKIRKALEEKKVEILFPKINKH